MSQQNNPFNQFMSSNPFSHMMNQGSVDINKLFQMQASMMQHFVDNAQAMIQCQAENIQNNNMNMMHFCKECMSSPNPNTIAQNSQEMLESWLNSCCDSADISVKSAKEMTKQLIKDMNQISKQCSQCSSKRHKAA